MDVHWYRPLGLLVGTHQAQATRKGGAAAYPVPLDAVVAVSPVCATREARPGCPRRPQTPPAVRRAPRRPDAGPPPASGCRCPASGNGGPSRNRYAPRAAPRSRSRRCPACRRQRRRGSRRIPASSPRASTSPTGTSDIAACCGALLGGRIHPGHHASGGKELAGPSCPELAILCRPARPHHVLAHTRQGAARSLPTSTSLSVVDDA
jgi:hypothetical protein